jgi:hypothetical protein
MRANFLSFKNGCGLVTGISVVTLAVVTVFVPPERLSSAPWKCVVVVLGLVAILALALQMVRQSREDGELTEKVDTLLADRGVPPTPPSQERLEPTGAPARPEPQENSGTQDITGELYRAATAPRTISWELVRDVFAMSGHPEKARVDCDVLLEMNLVNTSKQTKYVRDIQASVEIDGVRATLERMPDLRAQDIKNEKYEYALDGESKDFYAAEEAMKPLMAQSPATLVPEQPIEGWTRFMARAINPDKINSATWCVTVVDSTGGQYPIVKVAPRPNRGEVTLRRLRG